MVDLDSGKSRRRLHDHPSTKAEKDFLPIVEGRPLLSWPKGGKRLFQLRQSVPRSPWADDSWGS